MVGVAWLVAAVSPSIDSAIVIGNHDPANGQRRGFLHVHIAALHDAEQADRQHDLHFGPVADGEIRDESAGAGAGAASVPFLPHVCESGVGWSAESVGKRTAVREAAMPIASRRPTRHARLNSSREKRHEWSVSACTREYVEQIAVHNGTAWMRARYHAS